MTVYGVRSDGVPVMYMGMTTDVITKLVVDLGYTIQFIDEAQYLQLLANQR